MTSLWNVESTSHVDCEQAVRDAMLIATATGSVGATATRDQKHVDWLMHQYALPRDAAEAEAQRRYVDYPEERKRWNVHQAVVARMQHSCGTCGEPIANTFDGGWVHGPDADGAIVADCADARGDDPIEPLMAGAR